MALHITVVTSPEPRVVVERHLTVEEGCTATAALQASGLLATLSATQIAQLELAIWGRKASGSRVLRSGDRLELVRPLLVDPKVARRERFAHQGAKKAGLFKTRRTGGKAGY